eukprot:GEZU01042817.1.p1 GENE.GEZU01042817.1~~GEZU01042817.1.p1  ORF type:complete len:185 (-),score=65.36 GEZU01042817.1:170-724(-)
MSTLGTQERRQCDAECIDKLKGFIKDIKFAMLTTINPEDGKLHSRPMATQSHEFDGKALWFFSDIRSHKMFELDKNHHVNVAFCEPSKNNYVSFIGDAKIVKDKSIAQKFWNPMLKAWFPSGLDDPNLALIRVDIEGAEYWDFTSNKMVQLFGFMKASLTGEAYTPSKAENQKIEMQPQQPLKP